MGYIPMNEKDLKRLEVLERIKKGQYKERPPIGI
jgi:hypothetical protein